MISIPKWVTIKKPQPHSFLISIFHWRFPFSTSVTHPFYGHILDLYISYKITNLFKFQIQKYLFSAITSYAFSSLIEVIPYNYKILQQCENIWSFHPTTLWSSSLLLSLFSILFSTDSIITNMPLQILPTPRSFFPSIELTLQNPNPCITSPCFRLSPCFHLNRKVLVITEIT